MAKKTSSGNRYVSTTTPTIGTGTTGGTIPTSTDPKPTAGGPEIGTEGPIGKTGPGTPASYGGPVDFTGNIGQFGSYGPTMMNMFGSPDKTVKTKTIYRDVDTASGIPAISDAGAEASGAAAQLQRLAGSQSDQARQEVLRRMGANVSGNSSFDPRRPQTGGLFGTPFSKTTDSKSAF